MLYLKDERTSSLLLKSMKWRKKLVDKTIRSRGFTLSWLCTRVCRLIPLHSSEPSAPPSLHPWPASPRTPPRHLPPPAAASLVFLCKTLTSTHGRRLPPVPLASVGHRLLPAPPPSPALHPSVERVCPLLPRASPLCRQTTKLRATSLPLSTVPRAVATAPRFLGSHRREAPYLQHHGPCGGALLASTAAPTLHLSGILPWGDLALQLFARNHLIVSSISMPQFICLISWSGFINLGFTTLYINAILILW
jgi:hypothetical protein